MKNAFISVSFKHREEYRDVIESIVSLPERRNITANVFVDTYCFPEANEIDHDKYKIIVEN